MFGLKKLFGGNKGNESESNASAKGKSKKDGKFFMELDEAVDSATSALDSAVESVSSAVSKVTEEKKQPAPAKAKKEQPATFEEKQNQPAKVTTTKRQSTESPAAPASVLQEKIPTSVKPVGAENSNGKGDKSEMTFAPQYLMPTTTQPRRRPGPSMEMFKNMARQVKTK